MPSNSQYFLRSEVEKLPWIRISILLAMDNPYCRAIVHICRECNKRADVKYFSWCDMHQDTDDDCGKRYTDYYRGYSAREMCHSCFIISRKFLRHPPGFRKNHTKQRKQKKRRALAPFDRDKKNRRKYKGPR
ncbi:hypothetical protein BofuT4_P013480.1 [Botrytis cinerea T4]|uniref:Uncharacterized protein n=1 Tax=Botryotinia fuckeliana (strain T4) TaxID=999810 RepID=G2XR71_BOTF4|nr:hypothetical protein BofuT4_P013480.1 [Botrytis cinerea T4]